MLAEQARGDVGGAAGRIGNDDLHRLRRIFVLCRRRDGAERETRQHQNQTDPFHCVLLLILVISRPRPARQDGPAPINSSAAAPAETGNQGARSCRPSNSAPHACLDPVQAVGRVLDREEHDIGLGRRLAGVDDVGRNVDHRAGLGLDLLVADLRPERAFEDVDPLLVRMRMRLRPGAGGHPHQPDDHAIALDAGAVGGRIVGAAEDVVHLGEIEHVFAVTGALGAGRPGKLAATWSYPPRLYDLYDCLPHPPLSASGPQGGAGRFRSERVAASTTCGRSSRDAQRDDAGAAITLSQRPQSHTRGTPGQCDLKLCSGRIFAVPARRDSGRRTVPLGTLDSARPGRKPSFDRADRQLALFGQNRRLALLGQNGPATANPAKTSARLPPCRLSVCPFPSSSAHPPSTKDGSKSRGFANEVNKNIHIVVAYFCARSP